MSVKWIGAMLIISGCTAVGFAMARAYRREEWTLRQLIGALDYMACELQFRMTPLPDLCAQTAAESSGCVAQIFRNLSEELSHQVQPDVEGCMNAALAAVDAVPGRTQEAMQILGSSLGRFDMDGQLKGLEHVRSYCRQELEGLSSGRDARLRSYQTLGICTGAALAILFV